MYGMYPFYLYMGSTSVMNFLLKRIVCEERKELDKKRNRFTY
jgi:hypothetical protein